jgi:hypothetical protein
LPPSPPNAPPNGAQYLYNQMTLTGYSNATFNASAFVVGVANVTGLNTSAVSVYGVVNSAVGSASVAAGRRLLQSSSKVYVSFWMLTTGANAATTSAALANAVFNDSLQGALVAAGLPLLTGTIILTAANAVTVVQPVPAVGQTVQCPYCSPPPPPPPPPSPPPPLPPPPSPSKVSRTMLLGLVIGLGAGVPVLLCVVVLLVRACKSRKSSAAAPGKASKASKAGKASGATLIPSTYLDVAPPPLVAPPAPPLAPAGPPPVFVPITAAPEEAKAPMEPAAAAPAHHPDVVALAESLAAEHKLEATKTARIKIAAAEAAALEARARAAEAARRAQKAENAVQAAEGRARTAQQAAEAQRSAAEDLAQRLSMKDADAAVKHPPWVARAD